MIEFKPFKAVMPPPNKAHLVASRSYITYSKKNLGTKLKENPYTFIHIINPEFGMRLTKPLALDKKFALVREKFLEFVDKNHLQKLDKKAFYIYRQQFKDQSFCGIIGGASVHDYFMKKIKIHEATLSKRESLFTQYLGITGFNAEPVLLSHQVDESLEAFKQEIIEQRNPNFDFFTVDERQHSLWAIEDKGELDFIENTFSKFSSLYIADGHHRSASSARLYQEKEAILGSENAKSYAHFLAYVIPENQLKIYEFNRLIKDLNGMDEDALLAALHRDFKIQKLAKLIAPKMKRSFALYINGNAYILEYRGNLDKNMLDATLLNKSILEPFFNIWDLRTDKRIGFCGGLNAIDDMKIQVDAEKYELGIALYPVDVNELKTIADNNETMPPKSTWIEPKLRSGLTIYEY